MLFVEQLGPDIGDHAVGSDFLAAFQPHADGLAAIDQHPRDRAVEADLDPGLAADLAP